MLLLTGSAALKKWYPDFREIKDIDYICHQEDYDKFIEENKAKIVTTIPKKNGMVVHMIGSKPIEFEIGRFGNEAEEFLNIFRDYRGSGQDSLNLFELYTFKMSHRYLKNSPHFKKTMDDILYMRGRGAFIPEYLKDWYKHRMKETYDYKHPVLKQGKDSFFSADGVNYIVDHDHIHEILARLEKPAFTLIKPDPDIVFCSKEQFMAQPEYIRLLCGLEEAEVLAIERSQLPNNFQVDRKKSFMTALMKVCTSITSGWFREACWESYYKILDMYDPSYVDKFKVVYDAGLVRPYKQ